MVSPVFTLLQVSTLYIATRNAHKVGEIRDVLGSAFDYESMAGLPGAPEPVEDAATFSGNAMKKAVALAHWLGESGVGDSAHVLADDSGLEVDALNGAPGVHSARFAAMDSGGKGNSSDSDNNSKLLRLLREVPAEKRTARFRCAMMLVQLASVRDANLNHKCVEGICEGRILMGPKGRGGFGYDPLFVPDGYERTFAELGADIKNRISHRARALAKLKLVLEGDFDCAAGRDE